MAIKIVKSIQDHHTSPDGKIHRQLGLGSDGKLYYRWDDRNDWFLFPTSLTLQSMILLVKEFKDWLIWL